MVAARPELVVRRARRSDLPALGRLGATLARAHHDWDPKRFFVVPGMAAGYAWWLGKELRNRKAVVLTAVIGQRIVGYAYGRIEPRDWNALRDECGAGIDLIVDPKLRGRGYGKELGKALLQALAEMGAPRVVLQAAAPNRRAQKLFAAMGFRPTMVEMTLELPNPSKAKAARR